MTADHDAIRAEALYMIKDFDACDLPGNAALVRHLLAEVERLKGDVGWEAYQRLDAEEELIDARARVADLEAELADALDGGPITATPTAMEQIKTLRASVAELKVEVERLTAENAIIDASAMQYIADRAALSARVDQLEAELAEARLVCSGCGHSRPEHIVGGCDAVGSMWGGDCPCTGADLAVDTTGATS